MVDGASGIDDPLAETWAAGGAITDPRIYCTATALADGTVLLTGGVDENQDYLADAQVYDPATDAWAATTPMTAERAEHTATRLPSGAVLVAGGFDGTDFLSSTEIYLPDGSGTGGGGSSSSSTTSSSSTQQQQLDDEQLDDE